MLDEQKKLIQEQHRLEQAQMRNRSKEQKARTRRLIQEQHRLEQAQMRNRSKEQKARTRRLIQEGAILEKVFPWVKNIADLEELENRLCAISKKAE